MCLSQFVPGTVQENGRKKKQHMGNGLVTNGIGDSHFWKKVNLFGSSFVFLFCLFGFILVFFPRQSNSSELPFCVILCVHSHVHGARIKCQLQA